MSRRYGILGGTFDPIHIGHLIIAEQVADELQLDRVFFVPSGRPPHKRLHLVTAAEHRYQMVSRAIAGNPRFEISRFEVDRQGYSYTVDTLKQFRQELGAEVDLYFILGTDALRDMQSWYQVDEVFGLCLIAAVERPGYPLDSVLEGIGLPLSHYRDKICPVSVSELAVASSEIRQRIRQGKSVKYLIPAAVEEYITHNGLYRRGTN